MLLLPLYTRIKREEVLDQFVRGKVLGYIVANPGDHYNAIMRRLNLGNGSFAHHVHTLEREGYVRGMRDGRFRRYYPAESPLPSRTALDTQERVFEAIRVSPGITKRGIADQVGISRETVAYHVRLLELTGMVRSQSVDRTAHHWVRPALENESSGGPGGDSEE